MPYLHLDLPGTYPVEVKRELATRFCELYAVSPGFRRPRAHNHGHGRVSARSLGGKATGVRQGNRTEDRPFGKVVLAG